MLGLMLNLLPPTGEELNNLALLNNTVMRNLENGWGQGQEFYSCPIYRNHLKWANDINLMECTSSFHHFDLVTFHLDWKQAFANIPIIAVECCTNMVATLFVYN